MSQVALAVNWLTRADIYARGFFYTQVPLDKVYKIWFNVFPQVVLGDELVL
jgi:hypothetical protein